MKHVKKLKSSIMKRFITQTALAAGVLSLCHVARANIIDIVPPGSDFPAGSISTVTGNTGLGDANVLAWLTDEVSSYNTAHATSLPSPDSGVSVSTSSVAVGAGDYLVLHYGGGRGGSQAGSLVALFFDSAQQYDIPANGSGPNGNGGISFARLYDPPAGSQNVPDSGSTVALFGLGLCGIMLLTRSQRRGLAASACRASIR
jgi:hypothetical protein